MSPLQPRRFLLFFLLAAQVVFAALSLAVYRTRPQGLIASDGKGYYAWLRSVALDGDIEFENDYALIYPPDPVPVDPIRPDGKVANKYPVGVGLAEIPGFIVGHAMAFVLGAPRDGVSAPYQFGVVLWLQALCLVGLWLLWSAVVRLGAEPGLAALAIASALVATNLVQYIARPAMAHGPGVAILCIAIYLSVTIQRPAGRWSLAALGALLGLAVVIRASNLMLAPFFVVLLWPLLERSVPRWASFAAGFAALMALQVAFASAQSGQLAFSSYGDEGFTSGVRGITGGLFTARHGLFVYHPWYLVALVLCVFAAIRRETRALAIGALVSFSALAVLNGTWWSWWFGDGFGNRSYVEFIPVALVPGILWLTAVFKERGQVVLRYVAAATIALTVVNLVLWTGFILRRFPPDGSHTISQAYLWWR